MSSKNCKQCDARLNHIVLGQLGHGGTDWWSCPNGCRNIWGNPEGLD